MCAESFDDINIDDSFAEDIYTNDLTDIGLELEGSLDVLDPTDVEETFEDNFAKKIENLSLEELNAEREKLVEMGALDGEAIAKRYDAFLDEQRKHEEFSSLIEDLSKEQLQQLKGNLLNGDEETLKILGINHIDDDSSAEGAKTLRLDQSYKKYD